MFFQLTLFITLYLPLSFFQALDYFKRGDISAADSLLNLAYFEADSFTKNEVLFAKEILARFFNSRSNLNALCDYFRWYYAESKSIKFNLENYTIDDIYLENYIKLIITAEKSKEIDSTIVQRFLSLLEDTLLCFSAAHQLILKYGLQNVNLRTKILDPLLNKYPQSPYFELIQGYLGIKNSD